MREIANSPERRAAEGRILKLAVPANSVTGQILFRDIDVHLSLFALDCSHEKMSVSHMSCTHVHIHFWGGGNEGVEKAVKV